MKNLLFLFAAFLSFFVFNTKIYSQIDISIGNQIWMKKNLDVDKFRNGDIIPEAKTAAEWRYALENFLPAWCYYDNDSSNCKTYGKLYNWYAVNDSRGLAPEGWQIPNIREWLLLVDFLGGSQPAGIKLKNNSGWNENGNGTNESGFAGLPGGYRDGNGDFFGKGTIGEWWSNSEFTSNPWFPNDTAVWCRSIRTDYPDVLLLDEKKSFGFSVRCVKD